MHAQGGTNAVRDLLRKEYRSVKFEALCRQKHHTSVFSARANIADRILLIPGKMHGQHCWVLADTVLNHDYEKSKYLGPRSADSIKRLREELDSGKLKGYCGPS